MSFSQKSEPKGVKDKGQSGKEMAGDKKRGKQRTEIGRALRTVYDNTLRESVPDDFMDLLGKLD